MWLSHVKLLFIMIPKTYSDLQHDTGYPYPVRIFAFFLMIRAYSILIWILAEFMDTLFLTILYSYLRHKTVQYNAILVYC